jgi:uroporphyrinogen decarboxylase
MNGYQRIQAVLKGEWADQRPVMLHNFMPAAAEAGMSQGQYRSTPENIAKAHIQAAEKYDLDGVFIDVDTATTAAALGVPTDYPDDEPARCHGMKLTSLDGVDDLEPVDLSKNERVMIWVESCRLVKQHFGDEKFVRGNCDQLPFSVASMLRTPQEWMMDLMLPDQEEQAFKLLDYSYDVCTQFVKLMADTGVDMVSHGDSPAGPEMISPNMYRKYALPYQKKIADLAHDLGKAYLLHICGSTEVILDAMIESGADAFDLDYKSDVQVIHDKCADKVVLSGNIDPSGVLALGTPELVIETTRNLLEVYKDSPRLIACSGCALPPGTPEANMRAMIDTVRSFGK